MQFLHNLNNLIDFFLPRICLCCNTKLSQSEKVICPKCFSSIESTSKDRLDNEFIKKFSADKIIDGIFSTFIFQPEGSLQILLHELKYRSRFRIGNFLGRILAESLETKISEWNIDYIVSMPLHKLKKAERGYNQSDHIAISLSKIVSVPFKRNLVKRIKFTQSQTKLNLEERKKNITGAFKVKKSTYIKGKNILILDDVITTGASVSELGRELKKSGAKRVYACSVALTD